MEIDNDNESCDTASFQGVLAVEARDTHCLLQQTFRALKSDIFIANFILQKRQANMPQIPVLRETSIRDKIQCFHDARTVSVS